MKSGYCLKILTALLLLVSSSLTFATGEKLEKLTLSGPFAAVSNPMIRMINANALQDVAERVEFVVWKDPDQMRALALNGKTDFIATPTNVAANLYNRGKQLTLLNVSIWGIMWMVSRDPELKTLADFKGKEIAMPFRGDMPDLVFREVAERQGLNPRRDFNLRYVANPLDAMQLLILRRVDHALLVEPAISMALRKTKSFPAKLIAPDLYRTADMQEEWGKVFNSPPEVPQAGIALLNTGLPKRVVKRFMEEHQKAVQWCNDHPDEAGKIVAERIDMLTPEAVSDSIRISNIKQVSSRAAKKELEHFFRVLHKRKPALVGGKLPDDGFYYP
ncbi:MAG: ABC transporter substrate-binding protein [Proteobacteria bacterium]|nr:MAG: ABC transporter substrate-binding protein [Pseudomonadota bacterium]